MLDELKSHVNRALKSTKHNRALTNVIIFLESICKFYIRYQHLNVSLRFCLDPMYRDNNISEVILCFLNANVHNIEEITFCFFNANVNDFGLLIDPIGYQHINGSLNFCLLGCDVWRK